MRAIPFALSISHFVSKIGADAGFAALIGLALLILLYFAQARETATLRDRASQSEEQVQQLERRLSQLMRGGTQAGGQSAGPATGTSRVPVIPAPAGIPVRAAAAAAPANSRAVAGRPAAFAPAGVGAPALASATRMTPASQQDPISVRATPSPALARAATPVGAGDAAPVAVAAAAAGAALGEHAASGSGGGVAAAPGPPPGSPTGPRPATAAGGANGGRIPPPAGAPAPMPAPPPPAMRVDSARQNPQARLANSRSAPAAARRQGGPPGRSRVRGAVMAVIGLLVIAAIVVALLILTSSNNNSSSRSSSVVSSSASGSHRGRATALKPGDITVAVLNGTQTTGLAHDITQRLSSAGFKTGTPATASDQALNATVVGYRGRANRRAAVMVARSLKLGPASVQQVNQANEAVACPQASSCTTQVVVTVGADLESAASSGAAAGSSTTAASTT